LDCNVPFFAHTTFHVSIKTLPCTMEPIHLTTATILNPAESNILEYVAWCVWNVDIYKVMAYPSYTKSKMKDATDETRMKASKRFQPRPPFSHWWMRLSPHAAKMAYYQHGMVKATKRAMLLVVLGLIWAVQSAVVTSSSSGWRNRAVVHAPNLHCKNHPEQQQQRKRGNAMIPETTAVFPTRSSHKSLSTTASSIATTAVRGGGGQLSAAAAQVRMAHGDLMACTCMTTHLLMATTSLSLNVASFLAAMIVVGADAKLPPPTAAAALCGTVAIMSAHVLSSGTAASGSKMYYYCYAAALLVYSALAGLIYNLFDAYQVSVGVGGRLGVMLLCGNVVYKALFCTIHLAIDTVPTSDIVQHGAFEHAQNEICIVH
jgi:hypothetical protein